jgi:hypothetical protein
MRAMVLLWTLAVLSVATATERRISVRCVLVALDEDDASVQSVGRLAYQGGISIRSADGRFGGLSGLQVAADGRSLVAVSDRGFWVTATIVEERGRLAGVRDVDIAPLRGLETAPRRRWQRPSDAEAVTRDDGAYVVSFERIHRLWRYPIGTDLFTSIPTPVPAPPGIEKCPANGGIEALASLGDGRLLAVSEELRDGNEDLTGWILQGGHAELLGYPSNGLYRPTDLAVLPGGDVLVLERRFTLVTGPAARVMRIPRAAVRPGGRLVGEELAVIERPLTVDNFEGLAVVRDPSGGVLVYLLSDDNYSPLQRTLLLRFRLAG